MKITYYEYEKLQEKFQTIKVAPFYPNPVEIEEMEKNPEKWILFACYLYEKCNKPVNAAEKYSRINLKEFIYRHLEFEETNLVNIELRSYEHGSVQFAENSSSNMEAGTICKLEISPNSGYHVKNAYILDGLFENKILCNIQESGEFVVPDMDSIVVVIFEEEKF